MPVVVGLLTFLVTLGVLELQGNPQVTMVKTEQPAQEVQLILKFSNVKYTYNDILAFAKDLRANTPDVSTKNVLSKYITSLEETARLAKERSQEKNEFKSLIYLLKDERDFGMFISHDANGAAKKLLAKGKDSIPHLIDALDNDELTRSVSIGLTAEKAIPALHVLRIGDCACGILREITGQDFGNDWYIHNPKAKVSPTTVKELARKWWNGQEW